MSAAFRMIAGLLAGMILGIAGAAYDPAWLNRVVAAVEPIGIVFINAIRLTVVPLVVSKLIVATASAPEERTLGRVGSAATVLIVGTVTLASTFALALGRPVMDRLEIRADMAAVLRQNASAGRDHVVEATELLPGIGDWIVQLVPTNIVGAAAEGAMLPLIFFSIAFGLALARVERKRCQMAADLFETIGDAMLTLIRWILIAAPIGVFALAVPLGARLGIAAAGALLHYVVLLGALSAAFALLVIYPAAVFLGGIPLSRFARAAAPAQAVALSSRSSLASLPVMIQASEDKLGVGREVVTLFLPLAAATFRAGSGIGMTVGALFLARLYGVDLTLPAMVSIVIVVVVTSLGAPGIPSGAVLVIVPVLIAAGIPVEGAGILIAVDTVPDMIRTVTNVTADMAGAAVIGRRSRQALAFDT